MKKLFLLTSAFAALFTGCMVNEGDSGNGDVVDEGSMARLNISLSGRAATRAMEGKGKNDENTNQIGNVHVFILDAAGTEVIDYAPVTVASDLDAIRGSGWIFPDPIPVDSRVFVLGNVHRDYNRTVRELETIGAIRTFTSDIWTQTDYDYSTMSTVGDPLGFEVTASGSAKVSVELAPVISRLELHSLEAGGEVRGYTVTGVFLTNYHTAYTYGGGIPSGSMPVDNTLDLETNDGMTGDEANVIAYGTPLRAEMTGNRIWAYNVSAGSMPLLIVRLKNVTVGSKLHPGPLYITVSSYGGTTEFRAGKIYRIPTLRFTEEHLTLAPVTDGGLSVAPIEWDYEEITAEPTTPTARVIHIVPPGGFSGSFPATGASTYTFSVNAGASPLLSWSATIDDDTHFAINANTAAGTLQVRTLGANLTDTPYTAMITVRGEVDATTRAATEHTTTFTVMQLPTPTESTLSVSPSATKTFPWNDLTAQEYTVESNVGYTVTISGTNANRFKINALGAGLPYESAAPDGTFTIAPTANNTTGADLTATVTVQDYSGDESTRRSFTVTQPSSSLSLDSTADKGWEYDATEADTRTVTSNAAKFTVTLGGANPGAFKINDLAATINTYESTGSDGEFTISPAGANSTGGVLTATVTVQGQSGAAPAQKIYTVTQFSSDASLVLNPAAAKSWAVGNTDEDTRQVTSNVGYKVTLSGANAEMFRINDLGAGAEYTGGTAGTTLFTVSPIGPNTTGSPYTATVTVQGSDDSAATKKEFTLTQLSQILVTGIALEMVIPKVYVGYTATPLVTFTPTTASVKTLTWSSSAPSVASVDAVTGVVRGVAPGSATITATATDGSDVEGTVDITVESESVPATADPEVAGDPDSPDNILIFTGEGDSAGLGLGKWGDHFDATNYTFRMAFFKWGSVVGFTNTDTHTTFHSTVPGASTNAVKFNPSAVSFATYAGIPYENIDNPDPSVDSHEYTSLYNVRLGKGDPCRLVGLTVKQIREATPEKWEEYMAVSKWRLPTTNDNNFVVNGDSTDSANRNFGTDFVSKTGSPTTWSESTPGFAILLRAGSVKLPAAGYRNATGAVGSQGTGGYYWSSTRRSATYGYSLYFSSSNVNPSNYLDRSYGFAVRCVPQE